MAKSFIFSSVILATLILAHPPAALSQSSCKTQKKSSLDLIAEVCEAVTPVPKCFDEGTINQSGGSPESQMSALMSKLSDEEVFTRLIMAETIASGCPSKDLSQSIAWVLKNRVEADKSQFGQGREVVFKKYQFRSSTGSCDVAQRKVFLCPTSLGEGRWLEHWNEAQSAYQNTQNGATSNPLPKVYNYFFFKHFDESKNCAKWKGATPDWAKESKRQTPNELTLDSSCVGFYKE